MKIAISPDDKKISSYTFRNIGARVLEELGYKNNPHIIYRHTDTAHPHIHIVLSRITFDGQLVRDSYDGLKLKRIEALLEKEFELTPNRTRLINAKGIRMPGYTERWMMKETRAMEKSLTKQGLSKAEINKKISEMETGKNTLRNYVINSILESIHDHPTDTVYLQRLERRGISLCRHEFKRGNKKHYGLTYQFDPDKVAVQFKSKAVQGVLAGMEVGEMKQGEQIKGHPYLDGVPLNIKVDKRGVPQLCMYNTDPAELKQKVSFRASNLGPFFLYDNLKMELSSARESTFEKITFKRTKRASHEQFPAFKLIHESAKMSCLMMAAELRSRERVNEVLQRGVSGQELQGVIKSAMPEDFKFIRMMEEELRASRKKQLRKEPAVLERPLVDKGHSPVVETLMGRYQKDSGKIPNAITAQAIALLQKENWKELAELMAEQIKTPAGKTAKENLIDERILKYVKVPGEQKQVVFEYNQWADLVKSVGFRDTSPQATTRAQVEVDTQKLVDALRKYDDRAVKKLLELGSPDVKLVPVELLANVKDAKVSELLISRSALATFNEGSAVARPKLKSEQDKVNPSNKDHDLDQDEDFNINIKR